MMCGDDLYDIDEEDMDEAMSKEEIESQDEDIAYYNGVED